MASGDIHFSRLKTKPTQVEPGSFSSGVFHVPDGVKIPSIYPTSDSSAAIQIRKADNVTSVVSIDTTNTRLGVGGTPQFDVHLVKPAGTYQYVIIDSYGDISQGPTVGGRSARGVFSNPTATALDDSILRLTGSGYSANDVPSFTSSRARLDFCAAENFTSTNQGAYISLHTTPIGSTTIAERIRVNDVGNVGINSTIPRKRMDILDSSSVQLRLTHTDNSVYTDFQTSSGGDLTITPSGGDLVVSGNISASNISSTSGANRIPIADSEGKLNSWVSIAGPTGPTGSQGNQGLLGITGPTGSQGNQGTQGNAGTQGNQGNQGFLGSTGPTGSQGNQGTQGNTGTQGNQGNQGFLGSTGPTGSQGNQGIQGNTGTQGNQGNQGNAGTQGTQGNQGATSNTPDYSSGVIELGTGPTGNRYAYIDFHGDDTYTDYGLRMIRANTGPNAISQILHHGTGDFGIATLDASDMYLMTSSTERIRINSSGNVGIGLSPSYRLDVTTATGVAAMFRQTGTRQSVQWNTISCSDTASGFNYGIIGQNVDTTPNNMFCVGGAGAASLTNSWIEFQNIDHTTDHAGNMNFCTRASASNYGRRMIITSAGLVGINTTGPDRKLDVLDASNPQLRLTHTDGSVYTDFQTDSGGSLTITPTTNGSIVLKTVGSATVNLEGVLAGGCNGSVYLIDRTVRAIDNGSTLAWQAIYTGTSLTTIAAIKGGRENATDNYYDGYLDFYTRTTGQASWASRMRISSVGNVGINCTPNRKLDIAGTNPAGTSNLATYGGLIRIDQYVDDANAFIGGLEFQYTSDGRGFRVVPIVNASVEGLCFQNRNCAVEWTTKAVLQNGSGNFGINILNPIKKLEVLDASAAQLRLTHTAATYFTDLQTTSNGTFNISPTGGQVCFAGVPFPSVNNTYSCGYSNYRWSNVISVLGDFSGKLTAGSDLIVGGYLGWSLNTQTMPTSVQGLGVLTWNQSGGTGEVDIWDTYGGGFSFYTKTGVSTALLSMRLLGTGEVGIGCTPTTGDKLVIFTTDGSGSPGLLLANDQTNKYLRLGYDDTYDVGVIYGGAWGGTSRNLILQGNAGYVGIGTGTATAKKLEVLDASAAQLRLTHTAASVYSEFQTGSTGLLTIGSNTGPMFLRASSGMVGFRIDTCSMPASDNGTSALFGVNHNYSSGQAEVDLWSLNESVGTGGFRFYAKTGAATANLVMELQRAGNVGIGCTPVFKLDITGVGDYTTRFVNTGTRKNVELLSLACADTASGYCYGLVTQNTNATDNNMFCITNLNSAGAANAYVEFRNIDHTYAGAINFCTRSVVGDYGPKVTINKLGYIGIGTTDPQKHIHISTAVNATSIRFQNTGMSGSPILDIYGMHGDHGGPIFECTSGKNIRFYNGQYALTLDGGGNAGINVQSGAKRLEVLDSSAAQLRLTHTAATYYTDFLVDSGGQLTVQVNGLGLASFYNTGGYYAVYPVTDNVINLGTESKRRSNIYGAYGRFVGDLTYPTKEIYQASTDTLTAAECYNTIINNYGQGAENTQTLPTAVSGLTFMVIIGTSGAGAFHVKAGTGDKIYKDGVALDDGDKVSLATPGVGNSASFFCFKTGASAYDWYCTTLAGTWTDGGA